MLNRGSPLAGSGSVREMSWMPKRQPSIKRTIFSMRT
jgi:hypothetical protein